MAQVSEPDLASASGLGVATGMVTTGSSGVRIMAKVP